MGPQPIFESVGMRCEIGSVGCSSLALKPPGHPQASPSSVITNRRPHPVALLLCQSPLDVQLLSQGFPPMELL